LWPILV